jgi:hypothetical protein
MLQVKNVKNSQKIEVRFLPKPRMVDRPLQRALLYSFLFHALLFGLFRIQYSDLHEREPFFQPIQVAIEADTESKAVVADVVHEEKKTLLAIDKQKLTEAPLFEREKAIYDLVSEPPYDSLDTFALLTKIDMSQKLYPMRLKLSSKLSKLELLEDGSCFFRKKEKTDRIARLQLAYAHYPITYHVTVDGASGKVIHSSRTKELLDKKLQVLADAIIDKIQFFPSEEQQVSGRLSIIFYADSEEIEEMLQ